MSVILQNVSLYLEHPWSIEDPPKFLPFHFENIIVFDEARLWALNNLTALKGLCLIYFLFVQFGPKMMKERKAFNLQKPLVLWNFLLAVFSIMGAARFWPTFIDVLASENGLYKTCCIRRGLSQPGVFWGAAFVASKVFEFGDTVFIVLRKRKLIFLHWFHHLSMGYCATIGFIEGEPISSWLALKFKVPKKISMAITSLQLLQFVTGLLINVYSIGVLVNGGECARTSISMQLNLSFGLMYLGLFTNFFYKSYIVNPKPKSG